MVAADDSGVARCGKRTVLNTNSCCEQREQLVQGRDRQQGQGPAPGEHDSSHGHGCATLLLT